MSPLARRLLAVVPALVAAAAALPGAASDAVPLTQRAPVASVACPDCIPGEILVQFRPGASAQDRGAALGLAGGRELQSLRRSGASAFSPEPLLVRAATSLDVRDAIARLKRDPAVEIAEPLLRIRAEAVGNDTYYAAGSQWGLYSSDSPSIVGPAATTNAFGSQAEIAWAAGFTGRGDVLVGILDEGIGHLHPELDGNVWRNPHEYVDGRDNDGNGYADDLHGWDFHGRNNTVYDGGAAGSVDRHGTQVAGVIGAEGGNGAGVAGMNWIVGMVSLKVMQGGVGTTADAVAALDYLTNLRTRRGFNVVAVNCSWSTTGYSQALNDAVLRAARAGILVVAAAGNSGTSIDASPTYPAAFDTRVGTPTQAAATYDAVIAVAALDRNGAMPAWSNWGPSRVDLAAPGADIVTTAPPNAYVSVSGTSLAAAHVTGAVALLASALPGTTAAELRTSLLSKVVPTGSLSGRVATGGRLDAGAMARAIAVHDGAVTALGLPTTVAAGRIIPVSVTVQNQGTVAETLTVAIADRPPTGGRAGAVSPAQFASLQPGAFATLAFTWSTSAVTPGTHVVSATVRGLAGERDTLDNMRSAACSVVSAVTPGLRAVSPGSMTGGTSTVVTVFGGGFSPGAFLAFTGGTGPQPAASGVVVSQDGLTLTATVSAAATTIAGAPWDVMVVNPDGRWGRLVDAFKVTP